jgi:hypothetical protein
VVSGVRGHGRPDRGRVIEVLKDRYHGPRPVLVDLVEREALLCSNRHGCIKSAEVSEGQALQGAHELAGEGVVTRALRPSQEDDDPEPVLDRERQEFFGERVERRVGAERREISHPVECPDATADHPHEPLHEGVRDDRREEGGLFSAVTPTAVSLEKT